MINTNELRRMASGNRFWNSYSRLLHDAADEIDRLRALQSDEAFNVLAQKWEGQLVSWLWSDADKWPKPCWKVFPRYPASLFFGTCLNKWPKTTVQPNLAARIVEANRICRGLPVYDTFSMIANEVAELEMKLMKLADSDDNVTTPGEKFRTNWISYMFLPTCLEWNWRLHPRTDGRQIVSIASCPHSEIVP